MPLSKRINQSAYWEVLLTLAVALSVGLSVWGLTSRGLFEEKPPFLVFLLVDFFYLVLSFYVKNFGKPIPKKLNKGYARRLWKHGFGFASLPLNSMVWYLAGEHSWLYLLGTLRGVAIREIWLRIKLRQEMIRLPTGAAISFIAIGMFFLVHVLSCGWMFIYPSENSHIWTTYNLALYWVVTTLTTVGYGDITPSTNGARLFAMLVMILGVGFYGLVIGQVSIMLLSRDKRQAGMRDRMESLHSFFQFYQIPQDIQGEVMQFYRHLMDQSLSEDESKILTELPRTIADELRVYINLYALKRVKIFTGCSDDCLLDVAHSLEHVFFNPGDDIIRSGDLGQEMYLIGHGTVRVHKGDLTIAELGDGQCIGEMALVSSVQRNANVTALGYCDLYRLDKKVFDSLTSTHADLKSNVEQVTNARLKAS